MARGPVAAVATRLQGLPDEFVPPDADVSSEVVVESRPLVRGQPGLTAPLDLTDDIQPSQAAVLAVRHESGALTFHLPESATRGAHGPSRLRFVVPLRPSAPDTATRGVMGKVVKAIVVKVAKLAGDKLVSLLLPKLVEEFEKRLWRHRGLNEGWVRVTKDALASGDLERGKPVSPQRSLLFIHGTFSSAAAAFGPLAATGFFEHAKFTYEDRVFAFNHFSLCRTPEENARMLLEGLPQGPTLFDVVTHGRGGLVLRTLVESTGKGRLGGLEKRFKFGRAVLVASPNEGTPLATPDRWDRTLGWLANVIEMLPDNPFTTGAAFVANGLVWLANHASGDIPGLHAMDAQGDPIARIQSPPGPPQEAYSALVANYHPRDGKLRRLMDAGMDQFFTEANDLVVPSAGGWLVDRTGRTFIPSSRIGCFGPGGNLPGDSVTHVDFFKRAETVDFLVNALEGRRQSLHGVDPRKPLPDRRVARGREAVSEEGTPQPAAAGARRDRGEAAHGAPRAKPAEAVQRPLEVQVMNGDLSLEADPLLLGHYASVRLTGTERVMDGLVGGAMSRSLRAGLYPLAVGTHQMFINDHTDPERGTLIPRPAAVIVIGLGEEGDLKHLDLVKSVRLAVINWARSVAEPKPNLKKVQFFELSSTLMGSGGLGVSAGQAARLIVGGIVEANKWLAEDNRNRSLAKPWPLCRRIRLIELYLDRATEAWRALRQQEEVTAGGFTVEDSVLEGRGGLVRPPDSSYRGAPNDLLKVSTSQERDGETQIEYSLDTRRARGEIRGQHAQSRLVRQLVESASAGTSNDKRIGHTLFNLLIPVELEADLARADALLVDLDPMVADIPWELLDVNDGERVEDSAREPWALRVKLLRKLRLERFREHVVDADVADKVLVIGDPMCTPPYQPLDAAREEALKVHELLKAEVEGVRLLAEGPGSQQPDAHEVMNSLFDDKWRIVHIAGHGAVAMEGESNGGVVLSNGTFLGAAEIQAMRVVPELVFINCCHLARSGPPLPPFDRAKFASSVARALIDIGVRCVIAAGWAVEDDGAKMFAEAFYGALLDGDTFVEAVTRARRATYEANRQSNTWAAYQCYGDPNWSFLKRTDTDGAAAGVDPATLASPRGLRRELERIAITTGSDGADVSANLDALRRLEERFGPKWGDRGDVAHAFGKAWFENGAVAEADRWLEKAVIAADASSSIRAAEQLANARSRKAWESVEKAQRRMEEAEQLRRSSREERDARARARALRDADRQVRTAQKELRKAILEADGLTKSALDGLARLGDLTKSALNGRARLGLNTPTMEHENLVGSTHKRRALVALAAGRPGQARRELRAMKRAYEKALEIGRDSGEANLHYSALNILAADVAMGAGGRRNGRGVRRRSRPGGVDREVMRTVRSSLARHSGEEADFFSVVSGIEADQYVALDSRALHTRLASLTKRYKDLHRRAKSPRKWASVYDNANLVLGLYVKSRRRGGRAGTSRRSARGVAAARAERQAAEQLLAMIRGFSRGESE